MYLETSVANAHSWLIQGQHLKINHTCSLVITDIHSPECPQNDMYVTPINNDVITCPMMSEHVQNSYFIWAVTSTSLLLLLLIISCTLISAIVTLRRKLSALSRYVSYSRCSACVSCKRITSILTFFNYRQMRMTLNTGVNVAYSEVAMKDVSNKMVDDDDYEEIPAIKAKPW